MGRKTQREDDFSWIITENLMESAKEYSKGDFPEGVVSLGAVLDAKELPRKSMKKLFDEKLVFVNDKKANPQTEVKEGYVVRLAMAKEKIDYDPEPMELHVLYENHDILILDKPAGITVNSPNQLSIANGVAQYFLDNKIKRKIRFLNRLDRDTSGCIIISKSGLAQSYYQQELENNTLEKWYTATVEGVITAEKGTLQFPMKKHDDGIHYEVSDDGKYTRTDYVVVNRGTDTTDVSIRLMTGKTHQIRVAFSHIGHPLVGDTLYGAQPTKEPFALRAVKLVFNNMRNGEKVVVEA